MTSKLGIGFYLVLVAAIVIWGGRLCWRLELKDRRERVLAESKKAQPE